VKTYGKSVRPHGLYTVHALCVLGNYDCRHTEYVTLIAFPCQHWLRELASMLRYTHTYVAVVSSKLS
jgi:hypothetical protein